MTSLGAITWAGGIPKVTSIVLASLFAVQMGLFFHRVGQFGVVDALLYPLHVLVFTATLLIGLFRAAVVRRDEGGLAARLALFGVADRPLLMERSLPGDDADAWSSMAENLASELQPVDRPDYRRRLLAYCITTAGSDARNRMAGKESGERHG